MSTTCGPCMPHAPHRHEGCVGGRWAKNSGGKPWACDCDHPSHGEGK